ncbi:MAG: RecQ family ATP-dependent DNA helicase, partial [Planctomycetota bacterium]|nr:RecQ family ATP-dependent DNA helicase [Planctomycetota bacterium]
SDWGPDFRPEYRMLGKLRELFPGVSLHAFTATATPRVREDIARELKLSEPRILVGSFDRPNLVYRVQRRSDRFQQILDVIKRHPDDSGIIYCIRRLDVDEICAALVREGYSALPYHAGMSDYDRTRNQDAFLNDRTKIIVATVAFGMGIDKSDVRYVIHSGAPKSIEHYQQESGRGGRDGLESECWLFFSTIDFQTWKKLQSDLPPEAYAIALKMLEGIERFCSGARCRHRSLVEYFGQDYEPENCQACDACLAELDVVAEPLILAQKILSSIVRQGEKFGGDYTVNVLMGSSEQRILTNGHDKLTTYGMLREHDKKHVREWVEQLVAQGFIERRGEFNVLGVTPAGRRLLKGELQPRLLKPQEKPKQSAADRISWEGVDKGLFETLRGWRKEVATARGVPPFVVFSDATLRELARTRPSSAGGLLKVQGIGEHKRDEYGDNLLAQIATYCQTHKLSFDVGLDARPTTPPRERNPAATTGLSPSEAKRHAFQLFARSLWPTRFANPPPGSMK